MTSSVSIGIVANPSDERAQSLARSLGETLANDDGVTVAIDESTASTPEKPGRSVESLSSCAFVVSIGGDGTLLYVVRHVGSTPVVGVNLGEVGFLTAVDPDRARSTIESLVEQCRTDSLTTRHRSRILARTETGTVGPALNEIVVGAETRGPASETAFEIEVDDEIYAKTVADGVLVATPTGSTAYNLGEGGPVCHPALGTLVMSVMGDRTPVPSLVVDSNATVSVTATDGPDGGILSDGRERLAYEPPETITVERATEPAVLAGPQSEFFAALDKLR